MYLVNKIYSIIRISFEKLYSFIMKRKILSVGGNFTVFSKFILHNGQYVRIGNDFLAMNGCRIEAWDYYAGEKFLPLIEIGDNVRMNYGCHIGAINKIKIGNNVLFGSHVFVTDHNHGRCISEEMDIPPDDRKLYSKGPVIIGDNVWVGENVVILSGVTIGNGCIIGANSVVTKSVGEKCVVAGNPARVIRS